MTLTQNILAVECVQQNNSVGFFGLDNVDGSVYASVGGHNNGCNCSSIRFFPNNAKVDMVLSMLTAARLANKTVRIDALSPGSGGVCQTGTRIYLY